MIKELKSNTNYKVKLSNGDIGVLMADNLYPTHALYTNGNIQGHNVSVLKDRYVIADHNDIDIIKIQQFDIFSALDFVDHVWWREEGEWYNNAMPNVTISIDEYGIFNCYNRDKLLEKFSTLEEAKSFFEYSENDFIVIPIGDTNDKNNQ